MFLSIPQEFFVPVVFNENFVLNNENNNMEYDTEAYREVSKNKTSQNNMLESEEVTVNKQEVSSNLKDNCKNNLQKELNSMETNPYYQIDNEYVLEVIQEKDDKCE